MSHSKLFEISHLHSPNKTSHPSWKINQRNTQLLLEKNLCTHELKLTLKKQMLTHGDVCINLSCLVWLDRPKPSMCLVAQLCWTHCDPMDSSPPGSSVRGDSLGKNTGVGSLSLLKGIFPTQGLNPGLPHYSQILYCLSHREAPKTNIIINYRRNIIVCYWCKNTSVSPPIFSLLICSYKTGNELWALHKRGLSIQIKHKTGIIHYIYFCILMSFFCPWKSVKTDKSGETHVGKRKMIFTLSWQVARLWPHFTLITQPQDLGGRCSVQPTGEAGGTQDLENLLWVSSHWHRLDGFSATLEGQIMLVGLISVKFGCGKFQAAAL